ncbi:hypothetical protein V8G54_012349 [Vigna mungo]|uniref:Uncharacterized protein n=1 Tax=Vigna mungo TaxID=3915 RepID=A0AAQ3NUI9_VIGMU
MVCEPKYVLELEEVGNVEPQVEAELEVETNAVGVVEVQTEAAADGVEAHVQADVEGQVEVEGEVEVEGDVEGHGQSNVEVDEYDVRSWNGSEEDVLFDHGDEVEFDIFEHTNQVEVVGPRGLSDSDWESETLNNVVESDNTDDDRDGYGDFGVFSMPKSMEQYKWEVGSFLQNLHMFQSTKSE